MPFVAACALSDIPESGMTEVSVNGTAIVVTRAGDAVHAMQANCPHMGARLCKGHLDGTSLICPKHKARFDLATGEPLDRAKILFLKVPVKAAKTYPAKVEDGQVLIEM